MLVRSAAGGIEVFMLRRSPGSTFAPDAYVFPGGTLEPQDASDFVRTAIRELFEECGVLIADPHQLVPFSHWITPESEPRRYDVHFFVAALPDGQRPAADAAETHDGIWIAPADALARSAAGALHVLYPTRKHLERLRDFDTVEALLAFARTKPIFTILPSGTQEEGFALPSELEGAW